MKYFLNEIHKGGLISEGILHLVPPSTFSLFLEELNFEHFFKDETKRGNTFWD